MAASDAPEDRHGLATLAGLGDEPGHHLAQDPAPRVGRQDPDDRDARGPDLAARHGQPERVRAGAADLLVAIEGADHAVVLQVADLVLELGRRQRLHRRRSPAASRNSATWSGSGLRRVMALVVVVGTSPSRHPRARCCLRRRRLAKYVIMPRVYRRHDIARLEAERSAADPRCIDVEPPAAGVSVSRHAVATCTQYVDAPMPRRAAACPSRPAS